MANMTLEDFFTLTELKNGLTTCARIEELIGVMKQQQLNAGGSSRQWSAGVGALACTQNPECLDLFIRLDGLTFLKRWLLEAIHAAGNLLGGCDDPITALLASLGKLPVNHHPERLRASGILDTVQKLLCHGNAGIEEAARAVLSRWGAGDLKCSTPMRRSTSCSLSLVQGAFPSLFDGAREAVLRRSASAGAAFPEFLATRVKEEATAVAESGGDDSSGKVESSSSGSSEAAGSSGSCEEGDGVFVHDHLSGARSSNSEALESCEMDALEIARQVAIEVEREVVDYREDLCSSSSTSSEMISNCAAVIPVAGGDGDRRLENEATASKFDFDLNMDACCAEDLDDIHESSLSGSPAPPIAVSASKGAPGFFIAPPCFEGGGAGWRGSAATSAFRPASPRRGALDGGGPKQRARLLDLDLNVTMTVVASSENYLATSSGAGRMELDLNCNGEEELAGSPQRQRAPRKSFDLNDDLFPSPKPDEGPVITIMGSRMHVNPSGDYIGAGMGMPAFPFFSGITAPTPFLTSSSGNTSGSNANPQGWDLNFGALQMEGGPAVDVAAAQNSLKRKEPESGWEPYGFGYKHVASWH